MNPKIVRHEKLKKCIFMHTLFRKEGKNLSSNYEILACECDHSLYTPALVLQRKSVNTEERPLVRTRIIMFPLFPVFSSPLLSERFGRGWTRSVRFSSPSAGEVSSRCEKCNFFLLSSTFTLTPSLSMSHWREYLFLEREKVLCVSMDLRG